MYDLIIIGAGPAGITAGIYAGRQGLKTLLLTKDFGGQIGKKAVYIENYPGFEKITGSDLIKKFTGQLKPLEVEIVIDEVKKIEKKGEKFIVSAKAGKKYDSLSVIAASGSDPRPLEVPGEKEFLGKGVSYCALCDGPIFKNKKVAIIGGGNSAFETARFLINYVKKVYILESGSMVKADQTNQNIVRQSGKAEVLVNSAVKEIKGSRFAESLIYKNQLEKKQKTLDVSGIFVEIGYHPATAFAKGLADFTKMDEIIAEPESCATKTPGFFAAGDCNSGKYKQIITAAGEGCKAALAAYEYLKKQQSGF